MTVIRGPWKRAGHHDNANAEQWRGDLHERMKMPSLVWLQDGAYATIERPRSVTFPICDCCGHIVWEWPHYEEPVPEHAVCERCFSDEASYG